MLSVIDVISIPASQKEHAVTRPGLDTGINRWSDALCNRVKIAPILTSVLSNNTSLSEYWNEYRNGQGCNVTIRVPIFRQRCLILFIKHMNNHTHIKTPIR